MINNQAVTSFTMKTLEALDTITVRRGLNNETKIHGDALIAHCSMARRLNTTSSFTKLGLSADWTCIKFSGNGDTGDTLSKVMKVGNAAGMEMTKALVPQDVQLIAGKVMEKVGRVIGRGQI